MKKIRSYTVVELLIVMILTALTVGVTYTCYTIVASRYNVYKKNADELAEYILMDKLLAKDIATCKTLVRATEGIVCTFDQKNIIYEFRDSCLLRKDLRVDTFYFEILEPPAFLQLEKDVEMPGMLLDEVRFEAVIRKEDFSFYYKKKYDAKHWMLIEETNNR